MVYPLNRLHLLDDCHDIRTIQELLVQKDVTATMIYTHVVNREGQGIGSQADRLRFQATDRDLLRAVRRIDYRIRRLSMAS
jgi:hypothetical protein